MSEELAKLICKTLEENPGAELKFTRTPETQADALEGTPIPDRVIVAVELKGGGRWINCRMYEQTAHEVMVESLESLRRQRADERLPPEAPKGDYVPTEAELAALASRTTVMCKRCLNTGVNPDGEQCKCLDPG